MENEMTGVDSEQNVEGAMKQEEVIKTIATLLAREIAQRSPQGNQLADIMFEEFEDRNFLALLNLTSETLVTDLVKDPRLQETPERIEGLIGRVRRLAIKLHEDGKEKRRNGNPNGGAGAELFLNTILRKRDNDGLISIPEVIEAIKYGENYFNPADDNFDDFRKQGREEEIAPEEAAVIEELGEEKGAEEAVEEIEVVDKQLLSSSSPLPCKAIAPSSVEYAAIVEETQVKKEETQVKKIVVRKF